MEVLDTLAISGLATMQKMLEFLKNESLQQVANEQGFPVKIQIPIGVIIKAEATFNKFAYINKNDKSLQDLFGLPKDCNLVSRKDGMKTLTSKKKRLAVANLAT